MSIHHNLIEGLAALVIVAFCVVPGPDGAVKAQAQAGPAQPWGLPPLPAGVGPVEKFADVSGTPQAEVQHRESRSY